ncbi:3-isopropylmalate dehydratase small subunit, partial [Bifidobacterium bifidum]
MGRSVAHWRPPPPRQQRRQPPPAGARIDSR